MKEKLEAIVGKIVLNGESGATTIVKLAKVLNYMQFQLKLIKKDVEFIEFQDCIDSILKNAEEMLSNN